MDLKLIVYDFDGVMTDNRVLVLDGGKEAVFCNRSDGLAIERIKRSGMDQIIVTTEKNPVVMSRASKLNISVLVSNNKKETVEKICDSLNISISDNVMFIGNDLNDLDVMKAVGFSVCPADACCEVKEIANIVTLSNGGEGVIREFYNLLLEEKWLIKK